MDDIIHKLVRKYKTTDPFAIAQARNILVRYVSFDEGTRGLYYRKLRRRFIVIDNSLTEEWQRVVCAHELAHDCMHPGISQFWMDKHTFFNIGKFERQANTFALKLLTYGKPSEQCESMEHYLISCGIPQELHHLYEV